MDADGDFAVTWADENLGLMARVFDAAGTPQTNEFDTGIGPTDIGNARTELVIGLEEKRAAEGLPPLPAMNVQQVAEAVYAMATLPPEANVQFMTLMATKMPYIGRG